MIKSLKETQEVAEGWTPQEVLAWSFRTFGSTIEMASGFGAEGMALIDIAVRLNPSLRVFTIDTGFLFPETYQLIGEVESRYGIRVERVQPRLTPSDQAETYGEALWSTSPDQCCSLRKVEPLKEKLSSLRRMDHRHSARSDQGSREFKEGGVGPEVSAGQDQPHCGLDK